jgi:hypothetical protein
MKRPVGLIVGAAAGALLVAAVGASAHSGFSLSKVVSLHSGTFGDEATGERTEPADTPETSPEPTDTPEAAATAEPTETPEAADTDTETNDDHEGGATTTQPTGSGEHDGGG